MRDDREVNLKAYQQVLLGFGVVILAAQAVRPSRNSGPATDGDLLRMHPPSPEIRRLLRGACYDCHSNETRYPWYTNVQPVGWLLARHVRDAKSQLNFSNFAAYSPKRQAAILESCADEVLDGTMPLKSYRRVHRDANLTAIEQKKLVDWFEKIGAEMGPEATR